MYRAYHKGRINVQIRLLKLNITQQQIANRLGLSKTLISLVISGRKRSRRVVRALARALRMKPRQVEKMIYGTSRRGRDRKTARQRRRANNKGLKPLAIVNPPQAEGVV